MIVDSVHYQWTQLPVASILSSGSKIRVLGDPSRRAVYFARYTNPPEGSITKSYVSNTEVPFVKIDDNNYAFTPFADRKWSFDRLMARPLGDPEGFGHIYNDSSGDGPEEPVGWEWALIVNRANEVRLFYRHPFGVAIPSDMTFTSVDLRSDKNTAQLFAPTSRETINDDEITNEVEQRCALATATPWDTLEDGDSLYLNDFDATDYHLSAVMKFAPVDLNRASLVVCAGPKLEFGIERLAGDENWYHATNDPRGAQFNIEGDEGPDS